VAGAPMCQQPDDKRVSAAGLGLASSEIALPRLLSPLEHLL